MTTVPFSKYRQTFAPIQTIRTMQEILASTLYQLERLELDIADLEADLRDAPHDWASTSATLKLTAARADQARMVVQAARDLRTIEALRRNAGMETTLLGRLFAEFNKGDVK